MPNRPPSSFGGAAQLMSLRLPHQPTAVQIVGLVSLARTRPRSDNVFRIRGVLECAVPVAFATAWEVTPTSPVSRTVANTRSCDGPSPPSRPRLEVQDGRLRPLVSMTAADQHLRRYATRGDVTMAQPEPSLHHGEVAGGSPASCVLRGEVE
ncbi:MAG TPA: hypothetical protein VF635_07780, partial [Propionibacteriaceae bacterium]